MKDFICSMLKWLRSLFKETEYCICCNEEIPATKEYYDNYGGFCEFCYGGVPADWEDGAYEENSCDCCRAGRQY